MAARPGTAAANSSVFAASGVDGSRRALSRSV